MNKSTLSTIIAAAFALTTIEAVKAEGVLGILDSSKQGDTTTEAAGCGSDCGSKDADAVQNQQAGGKTQKINTQQTAPQS